MVENILGKGENAGFKHFLLFTECFQKASSSGLLKLILCHKELIEGTLSLIEPKINYVVR